MTLCPARLFGNSFETGFNVSRQTERKYKILLYSDTCMTMPETCPGASVSEQAQLCPNRVCLADKSKAAREPMELGQAGDLQECREVNRVGGFAYDAKQMCGMTRLPRLMRDMTIVGTAEFKQNPVKALHCRQVIRCHSAPLRARKHLRRCAEFVEIYEWEVPVCYAAQGWDRLRG